MKLIDAVYEVLKDSAAPMGAMEIERAILDRRLYETKGKTLYASVAAAIYIDIKKQGAASRFAKCGKGMFALAGSAAASAQPELVSKDHAKTGKVKMPKKPSMQKCRDGERRQGGGYVYILTNPCFDKYFKSQCVKIGQAKNVEKRRATLNTSVPVQFEIYATLWTSKYKIVEKKIHQRLKGVSAIKELQGERRVKAENGEFYIITPSKALKVLREESVLIAECDKVWDLRGHGKKVVKPKPVVGTTWKNPTQLAKFLAEQGGNIKAAGGICQQLTGKRRVVKNSKWRKPMAEAGVRFDSNDMVIGW